MSEAALYPRHRQGGNQGGVFVAPDVGPLILGQDLQVSYLGPNAAHYNFTLSESLVLKIEVPDAICTIVPTGAIA